MKHVNFIFICVLLSIISYQAIKIKNKQKKDSEKSLEEKCGYTFCKDGKEYNVKPLYKWDSNCELSFTGKIVTFPANGSALSKNSNSPKRKKI